MFRILAVLLALGLSVDHYALDGKYTAVAKKMTVLLLHRI